MDRFSEDYLLKIVVKWEAIAGIIAQTGIKRRGIFVSASPAFQLPISFGGEIES